MPPAFELRPQTDDDADFLATLITCYKRDALALSGMPAPVVEHLLPLQVKAHLAGITGDQHDIILQVGQPVGRLIMQKHVGRLHVMELILLPKWRGLGLGTAILHQLQKAARQADIRLSLCVEAVNPALRLYQRLGFREQGTEGPLIVLDWG